MHCPGCNKNINKKTRHCIHCGYDLSTLPGFFDSRILPAGFTLDKRYRILDYVTSGGMANIYRVEDGRLKSIYALKEMIDNFRLPEERENAIHRFGREAEILAQLKHPSIPRVIDHFVENQRYYLVMDYIEGIDLESALDREPEGKFPAEKVLKWLTSIIDVLKYLHGHTPPIIYRDIKPSNILLDNEGKIFLIDFGIARIFLPKKKGTLIGTPGYAPPEQYKGQMDVRSDIYALGATLHHLITGRDPREDIPFSFPPVKELIPDIDQHTANFIDRSLSYSVLRRYADINEMEKCFLEITEQQKGENWFTKGCSLLKSGDFKEAEKSFNQSLKFNPDDVRILINRGTAKERQGKTDGALNDFNEAYRLEPDNVDVLYNLGCAMKVKGDLEKAADYFDKVITINPKHSNAFNNLGNIHFLKENWDRAIDLYEKALSITPDSKLYWTNLKKARKMKSEYLQKKKFDKAVTFESDPVRAYYNLGMHFMIWNRLDEAEAEFRKALRLGANNPDPHEGLGLVYYKKKDYKQAANSLRKALSLEHERTNLYRPLGKSYAGMGKYKKAKTCFYAGMEAISRSDDNWRRNNEFHLLSLEYEKVTGIKFDITRWEKIIKKSGSTGKNNIKSMLSSLIDGTYFLSMQEKEEKPF